MKTLNKKEHAMCIMSFDCYKYDYYLIVIISLLSSLLSLYD